MKTVTPLLYCHCWSD